MFNEYGFEGLLALHKEMKAKESTAYQLEEVLAKAQDMFLVGTQVKLNCGHSGVVTGYNDKKGGFYPGVEYPVYIKITKSDMLKAIGSTFEYSLDQLTEMK